MGSTVSEFPPGDPLLPLRAATASRSVLGGWASGPGSPVLRRARALLPKVGSAPGFGGTGIQAPAGGGAGVEGKTDHRSSCLHLKVRWAQEQLFRRLAIAPATSRLQ